MKRNISLAELKQARNSSQPDLTSMLLSTSDSPLLQSLDAQSPRGPVELRKMQEEQVRLQTALAAVSLSVTELREEMAGRFDRLEAALLNGKQP